MRRAELSTQDRISIGRAENAAPIRRYSSEELEAHAGWDLPRPTRDVHLAAVGCAVGAEGPWTGLVVTFAAAHEAQASQNQKPPKGLMNTHGGSFLVVPNRASFSRDCQDCAMREL